MEIYTNDLKRTLDRLREPGVLTVDMTEIFNRGNLDKLLFASDKAILIKHKAGMHMLWCEDVDAGAFALSCALPQAGGTSKKDANKCAEYDKPDRCNKLDDRVKCDECNERGKICMTNTVSPDDAGTAANACTAPEPMHCCIAHGRPALDAILSCTGLMPGGACLQYCWYSDRPIPLRGLCGIRPMTLDEAPIFARHYKLISGIDEARYMIDTGLVYAAEVDGAIAGFIGWHYDGSIGLLEIFPEYRRRGLGVELECFMHNLHLERGWIPYGHVFVDNVPSLKLQEKMGLSVSLDNIWWTFDDASKV